MPPLGSDRIAVQMALTCPGCCYFALQKVGKNRWECEVCGTLFNFTKMRNSLEALVGSQFQEDFIEELLGDAKPEAFPDLGERAWKWTGKKGTLYTLDSGNGWHVVLKGESA